MKKLCLLFVCCFVGFGAVSGWADQGDFGFAVKGGTLGVGGEIRSGVFEDVYMRTGYNILAFDLESSSTLVEYKMEADFHSGSFLMDWHPFSGIFRVTFGLFFPNSNEITVNGTPRVENFPQEYAVFAPVAENIKVRGTVVFNQVSPFFGLGWASNVNQKGWGVAFDMGVLFQGPPQMDDFNVISSVYTQDEIDQYGDDIAAINTFIEEEVSYVEDDVSEYQYYPVVTLTLCYNF